MNRDDLMELVAGDEWVTIDEWTDRAIESGCATADFEAHAVRTAMKAEIRRAAKSGPNNGSGMASVVVTENGEETRVYKQETFFNANDYREVIAYHEDRARYHRDAASEYRQRAVARGLQLTLAVAA